MLFSKSAADSDALGDAFNFNAFRVRRQMKKWIATSKIDTRAGRSRRGRRLLDWKAGPRHLNLPAHRSTYLNTRSYY